MVFFVAAVDSIIWEGMQQTVAPAHQNKRADLAKRPPCKVMRLGPTMDTVAINIELVPRRFCNC